MATGAIAQPILHCFQYQLSLNLLWAPHAPVATVHKHLRWVIMKAGKAELDLSKIVHQCTFHIYSTI